MFVLGVPFIALMISWFLLTYKYFTNSMEHSVLVALIALEEFLEMFGVTLILWAWFELLDFDFILLKEVIINNKNSDS